MAPPKKKYVKKQKNTRFTDRAELWMQKMAKKTGKESWRIWLQDLVEEAAEAEAAGLQILPKAPALPTKKVPVVQRSPKTKSSAQIVTTRFKKEK